MSGIIHFAHGNGFPSPCYRQFLKVLSTRYACCYIDKIGHNPQYPVTENWHYLVEEVIASIEKQAQEPVIGVGHSLGGILTLLASIERPELFTQVIMLDSPVLGPFKSSMIRIAKTFGMIDKITPAAKTRTRKTHWKNQEELILYLKSRPLFATFDDRCLMDYVQYGIEKKEDGLYLRFDREIEYAIYRTLPHILPEYRDRLNKPATLIYGDHSLIVASMDRRYMEKYFGIKSVSIPGTHLFPFEMPELAAEKVFQVIDGG